MTSITIDADAAALAETVAAWMMAQAAASTGRFAVALSGGSTPKTLYRRLAEPPYRDGFPWTRTHLFWGDERFVPPHHPDSNFRMVHDALLSRIAIPAGNVHPVAIVGTPAQAAASYQATLQEFYGEVALQRGRPLFDVTLLGLGADGHTASLFPGHPVLGEREAWAAAVEGATEEARITLTYPALESSAWVAFLVTGAEKRAMLARLRDGDGGIPAGRLRPEGSLRIFADAASAG